MFLDSQLVQSTIVRGTVESLAADGSPLVLVEGASGPALPCDILEQGHGVSCPTRGDRVVVLTPPPGEERGVVLGRLGHPPPIELCEKPRDLQCAAIPDVMVLEAKQCLTIRVGDGSITIRADGKILIKGKDLVSHAQRVNRIKGGSVAIN